jgi:hypothetical protein
LGSPVSSNTYSQSQNLSMFQSSLAHTASLRTSTTSPLMTSLASPRQEFRPPPIEGRMSVAIDFGECRYIATFSVNSVHHRYHVFGSGR